MDESVWPAWCVTVGEGKVNTRAQRGCDRQLAAQRRCGGGGWPRGNLEWISRIGQ